MSFFFTQKKAAPIKRGSAPAKAGKSSKETFNRLGCRACPLDKANNCTPKMPPDLGEQNGIYVLGDAPTEIGDEKGQPFGGPAGKLLGSLLRGADRFSYDNVIRDYDHYKDQPQWVAMECCRTLVTTSIERSKPRLIIGLGVLPLQWMLGSSDMVGLRGRLFAVKVGGHACWFMPTYHPSFIIEHAYEGSEPLRSKLGHCLKFDLARASKLADELDPPEIDTPQSVRAGIQAFNGQSSTQLGQVLALISEARKAPEKAIDLETWPLRPYAVGAKVLTVAISFGKTNFSFAMDHDKAGWDDIAKTKLKAALKDLLSDQTTVIAHNTPFEVEWLISLLGRNSIFHDVWECTMMQSHFLDERRGKRGGNDEQFQPNPYQALDFLVKQNFGIGYKSLFKLDKKNMHKADLDETLIYNGADTKYTLRLFKLQMIMLEIEGLLAAYREAQPRQPTVALMQHMGINIDQDTNKKFAKKLADEITPIEERIRSLPEVKAFEIKNYEKFNPASGPHVIKLFKEHTKFGKLLINAEGKESSDKATLSKINHPLAKDLEPFRNRSKLKSTYVDEFTLGTGTVIWPDGKIHPSFNTTFAETGRTSSDQPNQQNWPSRNDKWVREQVVAEKGHVLLAFDYGQLEGCTGAMCSKDKTFVKALWEDYDMHMEWAQRAAKLWPAYIGGSHMYDDKTTMKTFRGLIKNKLVFPAFFGAAKESIAGYLSAATGVEAPKHVIEKLFNDFWKDFSGVYQWQKRLVSNYYETGFVESPTGRRRHYPLSRPQAINYPIQSVACDIVCRAMVDLSSYASSTGKWYFHPIMNIHDDLTFSIPDDPKIIEEAVERIYKTMLAPVYPFINVPLSVTGSKGYNWLEMSEKGIGKFWSHKDL